MRKRLRLGLALASALVFPLRAFAQADVVEYYHLDALGNVMAVSNAAGAEIESHDYLPFGEEWCGSAVCGAVKAGQPKRFTGKERDAETGLDYFGARYYRANVGRFTTIDPVFTWQENLVDPQRWNRYAYARNNPLRYVDPDGKAFLPAMVVVALYLVLNNASTLNVTEGPTSATLLPNSVTLGAAGGVRAMGKEALEEISGVPSPGDLLRAARSARDGLATVLAPKKGKAPATVTAGYNTQTGQVAAACSGGGACAEDRVVDALGGDKTKVKFTEATRPRTGAQVPVCATCEVKYGRDAFPPKTKFANDRDPGE